MVALCEEELARSVDVESEEWGWSKEAGRDNERRRPHHRLELESRRSTYFGRVIDEPRELIGL